MIDKIWFVHINGKVEGPFSYFDLEKQSSLTLDTYVWKEGFAAWAKLRDVPELKLLLASNSAPVILDDPESKPQDLSDQHEDEGDQDLQESEKEARAKDLSGEDITLAIKPEPPTLLWFVIGLIALIYLTLKLLF